MNDEYKTCDCKQKNTPRSVEFQADLIKRLNRAIGQLNGVKNMIEDNRYCGDVLVQLSAAESAVRRISEMLLQDHLETCVVEEIRKGNDDVVEEVMTLMRRFR
ncbi:metal-sensing transcriptional repressor [Adlercreutzia agrestimuris]|uniref:metal-sensing transcriptional repressor n=1 Tax=Adlercreutzia agrestimuris TaxID=2941324 RepID=UPI002040F7A2|nr:metal-sensing transcriptional repressor [Adlercreutzia agrestimuris]